MLNKRDSGSITLEAVIAFGIFTLAIGSVTLTTLASARLAQNSHSSFALRASASYALATLLNLREHNFSSINSSSSDVALLRQEQSVSLEL